MIDIGVCVGGSCHTKGSYGVVEVLSRLVVKHSLTSQVRIRGISCMNNCMNGVCVAVNGIRHDSVTPETAEALFLDEVLSLAEQMAEG